jgi:hypothetical protein
MGSRFIQGKRVDFVMAAAAAQPARQQPFDVMKILLRNKSTGYFYAGGNQSTPDVEAAHDFETGLNALQYSSKAPSEGVEFVYLQNEDVTDGFVLPKLAIYQGKRA